MKMSLGYCYMLLLLFAFIAVVSGVVVDEKKKVGDEARFKPTITAGSSLKDSSVTWKYTAGGEVIKVIEWDNDFKTEESLNPKFKTRVALDRSTGELTIRNVQLDDNGLYTIEINNKEQEKKINLIVMEGVTKPNLTQEETSNPDAVMYLTCVYNATIRWSCPGGKHLNVTKQEKPKQGESLTFIRAEMQGVCCTCTLYNDVSEETSDPVCEKDLFTDSGNVGGIVAGILIAFILLIIILILLFLCVERVHDPVYNSCKDIPCVGGIVTCFHGISRFRNKPRNQQGDDENMTVNGAAVPQGSANTKQGSAVPNDSELELLGENPLDNDKEV